ncbi:hypothetical protein [Nostoc sp. UHCC 0252]|uniref:hypothetical protein n=1 Tax=Nostoc sp. UHCC 0252 TaxID=3110241 RepID=UPI002B213547|nr:hypothetical protein [Nostoc sp. UHCC 0252]MEA5606433.1 hypothetical protein [Nostoc sp. UHCC 0252]
MAIILQKRRRNSSQEHLSTYTGFGYYYLLAEVKMRHRIVRRKHCSRKRGYGLGAIAPYL